MASRQKFSNNGTSTLLADFDIGETTMSVQSGHGNARFPSLAANEFFEFTLKDAAGNIEICKCTQRTGDTFNIVERAQEGTIERNWLAGDLVEVRTTRDTFGRFPQKDARELITAPWSHQGTVNYAVVVGSGPGYTCTFDPAITGLSDGQEFTVKFSSAVTSTAPTLNPNSLGAKTIKRPDGGALTAGDIPANYRAKLFYDGTDFLLLNPLWMGWKTGNAKIGYFTAADDGWVLANDGSIGNAGSSATTRANEDTQALYVFLYTNISDTWCPVSGGRTGNAVNDFNSGKTITLPRNLGRALAVGPGTGSGLTARALGEFMGSETHQLTASEIPLTTSMQAHETNTAGLYRHPDPQTSQAHPIMQPTSFINSMVKL